MARLDKAIVVRPRVRRVGKVGGDSACCAPIERELERVEEVNEVIGVLRALADPTRLQIVALLAEHPGEVCVCDITGSFGLDQSTISHHLRLLRQAGIVECVRHGVWSYYFLRSGSLEPVAALLSSLDGAAPVE